MFILKKKEVSNDNLFHITKKALSSSTICKKPLVDITNITLAGSFQKRSIKKKHRVYTVNIFLPFGIYQNESILFSLWMVHPVLFIKNETF